MADASLTELVDIDPERVDAVKNPANGFPVLLMKAVNAKGDVDEKPDIKGAESILRQLAACIQSEAAEMAVGNWDEITDIEMLAQAACIVQCWMCMEQRSAEAGAMAKDLLAEAQQLIAKRANELGAVNPLANETSKESGVSEDTQNDKTSETPESQEGSQVEKSAAELVDEAVAKAVTPLTETIKGLEEQMAALKSTPIPGGPAVTVPASRRNDSERAEALAEAARHERLSKSVNDRELARYHEQKAAEFRKAANA